MTRPVDGRGDAGSPAVSSLSVPRRAVEVQIEELVLHGFAPGDRRAIADAVQVELAKLMQKGALPARGQNQLALKRVDAGVFQIKRGSKAESSGTQIARSVFRGLRKQMSAAVVAQAIQGTGGSKR